MRQVRESCSASIFMTSIFFRSPNTFYDVILNLRSQKNIHTLLLSSLLTKLLFFHILISYLRISSRNICDFTSAFPKGKNMFFCWSLFICKKVQPHVFPNFYSYFLRLKHYCIFSLKLLNIKIWVIIEISDTACGSVIAGRNRPLKF